METENGAAGPRVPWNKDKLAGQKPPLKLSEIWVVRTRLQTSSNIRELAMFNLAIGNKLRACDLTRLLVQEVCQGSYVGLRAMVMQQKTKRRVQFETTDQTRQSIKAFKPDYLPRRAMFSVHSESPCVEDVPQARATLNLAFAGPVQWIMRPS